MVIHDVLRRSLTIRGCSECDQNIVINHDDSEKVDQHHVIAFSDGAGGPVGQEYATYTFCSIECMKAYCDDYFQKMLGNDDSPDEIDQTEDDHTVLRTEG